MRACSPARRAQRTRATRNWGSCCVIPNLNVIEPGCNLEMAQALRVGVETKGPFYFRIVRCEVEDNELFDGYDFSLGKGVTAYDEGVMSAW